MSCVAYYLQKGHELNYLLNLSEDAKAFFIASMELTAEMEQEKTNAMFKAMFGSIGG